MTGTPFLVTRHTPARALVEVNPVCTRILMNLTRSFGQQLLWVTLGRYLPAVERVAAD